MGAPRCFQCVCCACVDRVLIKALRWVDVLCGVNICQYKFTPNAPMTKHIYMNLFAWIRILMHTASFIVRPRTSSFHMHAQCTHCAHSAATPNSFISLFFHINLNKWSLIKSAYGNFVYTATMMMMMLLTQLAQRSLIWVVRFRKKIAVPTRENIMRLPHRIKYA